MSCPKIRSARRAVLGLLAALPLAAHQPHDPISVVAMSPNYAQDQTMFLGTGALTMPLPVSECAQMQSSNGGLTFSVMSDLPDHIMASIAFSPDFANDGTVYMAGRGGVYRSTDRGASWSLLGALGTQPVAAVAVAPNFATSNVLYAATSNSLYGSKDRGQTWQQLPAPAGISSVFTALAISPNYAADATLVVGTAADGIYKSKDWGHDWASVTQGLSLPAVAGFAFSPAYATDHSIFAITTGAGLYFSNTGGGSWSARNNGITDLNGTAIAISPNFSEDSTVWVATAVAGVFRSTNRGGAWSLTAAPPRPLSNQTTTHFMSLAAGNGPSGIVLFLGMYEGLYTSSDGGDSWLYCDIMPTHMVRDLQLSPNYPSDQTVFISTYGGGTLWSTDGGNTWYFENTGLVNSYADAVAMSPNFPVDGIAFVGNAQGLERIYGGSTTWVMMQMLGESEFPRSLGISPNFAQDHTLFIGTHLGSAHPPYVYYQGAEYFAQGLFVSVDDGDHWEPTGMPCAAPSSACTSGTPIDSIAVSPNFTNDHTVFVGSSANGLFKSTNGAAGPFVAMTPVDTSADPVVLPVAVSPAYATDQTVIVATSHSGVFKSTNGAATWKLIPGTTGYTVFSIAFSPNYTQDQTIFLGTLQRGLMRSTDGGASFAATSLPGNYVTAVRVSPGYAQDHTVFATSYFGLYKSTDGGDTWSYTREPGRQEEQRQFPPGAFNTILYQGSWPLTSDPAASTIQFAKTTDSGASASLTFQGSGAEWVGVKGPAGGTAQVFVDGTLSATVNLYAPATQEQATLWTLRGLTCGIHTVTINAQPGPNQQVTLDALDVWQDTCSPDSGAPPTRK
jgi:photosystem II stability/assembly factor-like uncharacterized protein